MKELKKDRNIAVITTRFVLFERDPITKVYHHYEDGVWEFIGDHLLKESDYRVVSFDEVLEVDITVSELFDLPVGYSANRENKDAKWTRGKL